MAQVFLVPDPARRADRQGRLVDLPCGLAPFGPSELLVPLALEMAPS